MSLKSLQESIAIYFDYANEGQSIAHSVIIPKVPSAPINNYFKS